MRQGLNPGRGAPETALLAALLYGLYSGSQERGSEESQVIQLDIGSPHG